MKYRLLKNTLATILVLMIAVITFFTWNLIYSVVSNYQAVTIVAIAGLPMVFFMLELYVLLFGVFNYIVLKRRDAFLFRKYSLIVACLALLGVVSSILDGTIVYHTFIGDYIFVAFPLFMLIVHVLFLAIGVYVSVISIRLIAKTKPERTWKNSRTYWIREVLIGILLMFALEKLGGFLLLPLLWSSYDSIYVLPFYIELLVPTLIFVSYMVDRHWLRNKKINIILASIALAYSVASMVYMIVISHNNYPLTINALSPILQLERLITKPIGFIVLYAVGIIYPATMLTINIVKLVKEKKAQ